MKDAAVNPYLYFNGNCAQAVEFYATALGAQVQMVMRFKEAPEQPPEGMVPPGWGDKVMHASFRIGGTEVMASDGCGPEEVGFRGFSLSLGVKTEADADRAFAALSAGGKVTMPLGKTFWSAKFGMVQDKFGVNWMVNVAE